jgi:FtsP/CotA-like multicopper oxidase with cupredoxin domain
VKQGERVLFHVLNGSATEIRSLALPGHSFKVVALEGNAVSTPAEVPVLWLGTAERISAMVEMKHRGVWIMGDLADDDRSHGMGLSLSTRDTKESRSGYRPSRFIGIIHVSQEPVQLRPRRTRRSR